jgi:hypothetical protein
MVGAASLGEAGVIKRDISVNRRESAGNQPEIIRK